MDLSRAQWQKSTASSMNGCVEVAFVDEGVAIRDSKDRAGAVLLFSLAEWQAFLQGVRQGEFDADG